MDDVTYGHLAKEQLNGMKLPELKQLAADMGIEVTSAMKKADIVAAIAAEEVEIPEEETLEAESEEGPEKSMEAESEEGPEEAPEEELLDDVRRIKKVYVGPNLPGGMMNHGKILQGTEKSIAAYLAPILEKYPAVQMLMVPQEKLQTAQRDVKNPRKLMYQYAEGLKNDMKKRRGGGNA